MRYAFAPLAFGLGANALVARTNTQCFKLQASGGASGVLGQLDDGQNRVGGGHPTGCYCLDSNGGFTDSNGRGCILTPPTTQFQCDVGATPTNGFAVSSGGGVTYNGSGKFYACPVNDNGEYNVYTTPAPGQTKCVEISLASAGSCGAGASQPAGSQPAGKPPAATTVVTKTKPSETPVTTPNAPASQPPYPSGPAGTGPNQPGNTGYPGKPGQSGKPDHPGQPGKPSQPAPEAPKPSQPAPEVPVASKPSHPAPEAPKPTPEAPQPSQPAVQPPMPSSPAPGVPRESECVPKVVTVTVTKPVAPPVVTNPAPPASTKPAPPAESMPAPPAESMPAPSKPAATTPAPSKPVETVTSISGIPGGCNPAHPGSCPSSYFDTMPAPSQPAITAPAPSQPAATVPAPSVPAPSKPAGSCPQDLNGNYQYPHLIVPVDSQNPDKAYGTSYNGTINGHTCTIFNFDIPASYAGKKCSTMFMLPRKEDLETSDYTMSGHGKCTVSKLKGNANAQTTYSNQPAKVGDVASIELSSGNTYTVESGDCEAGQTVSYEICGSGDFSINYFQDWNPSPIGLYVRQC